MDGGENQPVDLYPLKDLKYDTTCLVTEDNTIIIRIPYSMDRTYKDYLHKLEMEARDL